MPTDPPRRRRYVLLAFGLMAALYSPAAHADPISFNLSIDVRSATNIEPFIDFPVIEGDTLTGVFTLQSAGSDLVPADPDVFQSTSGVGSFRFDAGSRTYPLTEIRVGNGPPVVPTDVFAAEFNVPLAAPHQGVILLGFIDRSGTLLSSDAPLVAVSALDRFPTTLFAMSIVRVEDHCCFFGVGNLTGDIAVSTAPVPEPGSILLLGTGLIVAARELKHRRRAT